VTAEQDAGLHRQAIGCRDGRGDGSKRGQDEREGGHDPGGVASARGAAERNVGWSRTRRSRRNQTTAVSLMGRDAIRRRTRSRGDGSEQRRQGPRQRRPQVRREPGGVVGTADQGREDQPVDDHSAHDPRRAGRHAGRVLLPIRLDGGDPTLGDGLRIAFARLPKIIVYAVIAATVGMILRWISERAGIVGQILGGVLGFAWSVATFLVVPVLVVENVGPFEAIKRSTAYLKRTWGEQLIGNVGIGLVFGLLTMLVIFVGGALLFFLFQASVTLGLIGVVALILLVGVLALIGSALSGIFTASVYRYATKGDGGSMFNNQVLATAFRQKG